MKCRRSIQYSDNHQNIIMCFKKVLLCFRRAILFWKTIAIFLIPILLFPLPILLDNDESKVAYVSLTMALFWCLELIPLPVTALFPVVMFPLMGIMSTKHVTSIYMSDISMNFVGSKYYIIY